MRQMTNYIRQLVDQKKAFTRQPMPARLRQACSAHQRRMRAHQMERLPVIIIKAQGKPLFVVLGDRNQFVSAFTWDRLLEKVVYGPWKHVNGTTLSTRLAAWRQHHGQ